MPGRRSRFTFLAKMLAALLLIGAADWLFTGFRIGSWLGGLALAWIVVLALVRPATRRGPALVAMIAAAAFAIVLIDQPGRLAWLLFWAALSIAALLPRTAGFDDAWRWAIRLAAHGVTGPFSPLLDLPRLFRARPQRGRLTARALAAMLGLPIAMSLVFVTLFASANPLIARMVEAIRLPSIGEAAFWLFALAAIWPSLRPRTWATHIAALLPEAEVTLPGASLPSVLISLLLFNAVFAIQNGLDIAFLWSGAPLPDGVTLAAYAHRGAYPLIATALLAGIFVLATMKPGSATAASPAIRRLVVLWVAQNLLLVASSILRTCDYIAVYMLTAWRIAALAWMGLVALGLVLICWRMLRGRSARWLINGNALAAALLLAAATVVDLNAIAAAWNVNHAREVGGAGVPLDLCQLNRMGPSALLPIIDLEHRPLDPAFRDRVRSVRQQLLTGGGSWWTGDGLVGQQSDWRRWTWRDARLLSDARTALGPRPPASVPLKQGESRGCGGAIMKPPVVDTPPAPPAPLTNGAAS